MVNCEARPKKKHTKFRSRAGICQYLTEQRFDISFSTKEIIREAAGPTTASQTKLMRIARYLKERQRFVLNFLWVTQLEGRIHVTVDANWAGGPKDRVLHVWRSAGNWAVLHRA